MWRQQCKILNYRYCRIPAIAKKPYPLNWSQGARWQWSSPNLAHGNDLMIWQPRPSHQPTWLLGSMLTIVVKTSASLYFHIHYYHDWLVSHLKGFSDSFYLNRVLSGCVASKLLCKWIQLTTNQFMESQMGLKCCFGNLAIIEICCSSLSSVYIVYICVYIVYIYTTQSVHIPLTNPLPVQSELTLDSAMKQKSVDTVTILFFFGLKINYRCNRTDYFVHQD